MIYLILLVVLIRFCMKCYRVQRLIIKMLIGESDVRMVGFALTSRTLLACYRRDARTSQKMVFKSGRQN